VNAYRVMAGVLIGSFVTLAPLYAAYLPVLNLLLVVLGLRAMMYMALSCVSAVVLRSLLYSNNKVENQVKVLSL